MGDSLRMTDRSGDFVVFSVALIQRTNIGNGTDSIGVDAQSREIA